MTLNLAESLNSMLNSSRKYPIVCLFETIRSILTRWFHELREKGSRHKHHITLEFGKRMKVFDHYARSLEVCQVNHYEFEVKGEVKKHVVNLETRQCTCRVFDIEKFPCAHAIAAAKHIKVNENSFVHECYSNERWILAYSESIHPLGDKADWIIPIDVAAFICRPPSTRIPSGRRRKKRIPCSWESRPKRKSYKCSRCGKNGHNKSSCVVVI